MRYGLIGYGAWGRRHAQAIAGLPGLELAAIACRTEASAAAARRDFPAAVVSTDYRSVLALADIDVIDIVVPNDLHAEIGVAALDAGKHVLLEKPMATSLEECDRLITAAERNKRILSIGHEFRLSTQWGRIKTMIDRGDIGEPRFVNINLFRNPYRTGSGGWRYDPRRVGSWVLEEAIHFFDFALWYMEGRGNPVSVVARGTLKEDAPGMYDNFSCLIHFPGQAYAAITQCIAGFEHHLSIDVTGTEGAIRATWAGAMDRDETPRYALSARPRGFRFERGVSECESISIEPSGEVFELVEQIRLTTAAIAKGEPLVSPQEARKRVVLCLEAVRAVREGGVVQLRF